MKISKATIFGVAHYAREQTIAFSQDEQRPITVLHGENGAGKTSTLNAILWCLTGRLSPAWLKKNGESLSGFINKDIDPENALPFVEVEFQFEGELYRANRKALGDRLEGEFSLKRLTGGVWDSFASRSAATMTNILPPGIARYFIFDGEGFQQVSVSDRSVISAVKTILGFDHVEVAIDRLEDCLAEKRKALSQLESSRIKDDRQRKAYERASEQIEILKKKTIELVDEKENRETELVAVRSRIGELNIARVNGLKREEGEKERQRARIKAEIQHYQRERLQLVGRYYRPLFGRSLFDRGLALIEREREKGVIPGKYSRQLIEDLKESGICICGRDIGEGEARALESKIRDGFTNDFQKRIADATACQKDDLQVLDSFRANHAKIMSGINDNEKQLREIERRLEEVAQELADLGNHQEELRELQNEEAKLKARLATIDQELTTAEDEQKSALSTRRGFKPAESRDEVGEARLTREINVLGEILSYAKEVLVEEFKSAHEMIQNEMSSFLAGTNIPYGVRLDESFHFSFVDKNGQTGYGSTGELKSLEYAFLCSLIKVLRVKSKTTEGLLQSGSQIPLVLDAPFSELAETYVKYIADMLLSVSDQLTVLMFNKDWEDFQTVCLNKIGKEYILVKNITDSSDGRAEEKFEFGGQAFACVRYGAEVDHTTAEEIE